MRREVLVDGRTLYVGHPGRIGVESGDDGGVYHRDTRHLSVLSTSLVDQDLVTLGRDLPASNRRTMTAALLDSTVNRVDDKQEKQTDLVCRETQAVSESTGLWGSITVDNHATTPYSGTLQISFDADFADVFEVRGFATSGDRDVHTTVEDTGIRYAYEYTAADGTAITRTTTIAFDPGPDSLTEGQATFDLTVASQDSDGVTYTVVPGIDREEPASMVGDGGRSVLPTVDGSGVPETPPTGREPLVDIPTITTGNPDYDRVFERSREDLAALVTGTEHGPIVLAGTPWFATVFGRDALIAAYQSLPVAPDLAAGTLRYLAAYQGTETDDAREEAAGKMFHEMRDGELAHRGSIPHTPYYGSIDATPLWIVLLTEYYRWTRSDDIVRELANSLEGALAWIRERRDTGFLAYEESPGVGLRHKAWRDTAGAIQFPDGEVATSPIASVEVQGYVYRALQDAATLYEDVLDDARRAANLREEASAFAVAFEDRFWLPETGYYAAALAGDGRIVPTVTSNVGHCLWAGIVDTAHTDDVVDHLRSDALSTRWGLRTMSTEAAGFSPVSYHLGSIWPHDTSLTALGLARYGYASDVERLASGMLDASTTFDQQRIPELFCGFADGAPKEYPSSCVPQAWSAAAPFALLRAAFDLQPAHESGPSVDRESQTFAPEAIQPITDQWNS